MNVTPYFVLGVLAGFISSIVTAALFFLVVWQGIRRHENQLMAVFLLATFVWAASSVLMRFSALMGLNPVPYLFVVTLSLIYTGVILLGLAIHYTGLEKRPWAKWLVLAVVLYAVVVTTAVLRGGFFGSIAFAPGQPMYTLTSLGVGLSAIVYLAYVGAVVILWQHRSRNTENLLIGSATAAAGAFIGVAFPATRNLSPPLLGMTLASVFFVRAVMQQNLFNPLVQLNEQLQKSEERYRSISELASDYAYAVHFEDGKLQLDWMTQAFTRITGYTQAELEDTSDWKFFVHPDDLPLVTQREKRLAAGQDDVTEYRIVTKQGEVRWLREYGRARLDEETGRLQQVFGAGQDITVQKEAEAELMESEAKHQVLLDRVPLPILALTPDMRVYYCNQAYANFVGMKPADLVGERLPKLFPMVTRTQSYAAYRRVLMTGMTEETEGAVNGRVLLARITPAPWGLLSVAQDITERQQMEEALAMSRMKTELLAKVSHELRTPLSAILGYTDMMRAGIGGAMSDKQRDMISRITVNTEKLLGNVNGMLDQAQIELGTLHLQKAVFSPVKLLDNMHAVLDVMAEEKGLTFTSEVTADMPPELESDFQRLNQILINLAGNAIKFTSSGSVHVLLDRPNEAQWLVQVTDTGSGIPKSGRQVIFDAFRQLDGTPTREYGGVGLGLSIVKQLVTLLGGEIRVRSEVGQGSTFTVTLPLTPVTEKELA